MNDSLVPSCEFPAVTSFPERSHQDSNPWKPVPVSKPGFSNFLKCFKYTKYNGEYVSHSQLRVAQWLRGSLAKPRVTYRSGSMPPLSKFSTTQKNLCDYRHKGFHWGLNSQNLSEFPIPGSRISKNVSKTQNIKAIMVVNVKWQWHNG